MEASVVEGGRLEDRALGFALRDRRLERGHDRLVEHVLEPLLGQRRALDVLDRAEFPCEALASLGRHRALLLPRELLEHGGVVPEIDLGADDETGDARAVVVNLQ